MMVAPFRHVDLVVSSLARSLPFYEALLSQLGWGGTNTVRGEQGEVIHYVAGPNGLASGALGLRERPDDEHSEAPFHNRYAVGLHHVAFNAPSTATVDEVAAWLRTHRITLESGPAYYYNPSYYAVYFYDPDGIKLEIVHSS